MKTNANITLDSEVLLALRERNVNISGLINAYLKEFLSLKPKKEDVKLEKLKADITKKEAELLEKRELAQKIEKELKEHEGEEIINGEVWKPVKNGN